jgi:hypothetical protein
MLQWKAESDELAKMRVDFIRARLAFFLRNLPEFRFVHESFGLSKIGKTAGAFPRGARRNSQLLFWLLFFFFLFVCCI